MPAPIPDRHLLIMTAGLDAVAEQELLAARQLVQRRDQPQDEAIHRLQRRPSLAGRILR